MEQILPGVSIEVRPEGLITPGQVSISTIGIVGTASRGPVSTAADPNPEIIGSPAEARQVFGRADAFNPASPGSELTLIRALDLAYDHGARDVIAVRVGTGAVAANFLIGSAGGDCCTLTAATPGSWANELQVNIFAADENALVAGEEHAGTGGVIQLDHATIGQSVRNRVEVLLDGSTTPIVPNIVYAGAVPPSGEVDINTANGEMTFAAGEEPPGTANVTTTYVVPAADAVKVTLRDDTGEEAFIAASGAHLVLQVDAASDLVDGADGANATELPTVFASATEFRNFGSGSNTSGNNGAANPAGYDAGLEVLSNEPAHIIVVAGQDDAALGALLTAHVNQASSDANKRERIGIIGSASGASVDTVLEHTLNSDRIVFAAPGVRVSDPASGGLATLSGGYSAAAVAGLIAGFPVHRSLTNKRLAVSGLEETYTSAELRRLVQARVLALEEKFGFRVVKGITTSTNTAWHQITTRRIVDKAKFGVRSAANPYIGLLNNSRVRVALQATIDSFLSEMVLAEELVSYDLNVTATRADEIRGIVRVTMTLRPVFSIDFIKVTMFLE